MKRKHMAIMVLLAFMLVGCATMRGDQTYAFSVEAFGSLLQTYNTTYETAPSATQQKWKEHIDPKVLKINRALETWRAARGTPLEGMYQRDWEAMFLELQYLLIDLGIIEIGG